MDKQKKILHFITSSIRVIARGNKAYYVWVSFLLLCVIAGFVGYVGQLKHGLIATNMRDQVSWGFYIGNFTFLVGVAAAAVTLVIPAYIYNWKPIKEIAVLGEILAVSALIMCMLFILVDIGSPLNLWHVIPFIGKINFPYSVLAWDAIVLNLYFALNLFIVFYILFYTYYERPYNKKLLMTLVFISIPGAISIHTITAFLYNVMMARPYWNSAILAPRFLISAFCSGPAIMIFLFQVLRKTTAMKITNEALWKITELMTYAMFFNLLLLLAEVVKEFYSNTEHVVHIQYYFFGAGGHSDLVKYAWVSVTTGVLALLLFLIPKSRKNFWTMNLGCLFIYISVFIEKGMGLVLPGFTPGVLGEYYIYMPSTTEVLVSIGIWGCGFLALTFGTKIAIPLLMGEFSVNHEIFKRSP